MARDVNYKQTSGSPGKRRGESSDKTFAIDCLFSAASFDGFPVFFVCLSVASSDGFPAFLFGFLFVSCCQFR